MGRKKQPKVSDVEWLRAVRERIGEAIDLVADCRDEAQERKQDWKAQELDGLGKLLGGLSRRLGEEADALEGEGQP